MITLISDNNLSNINKVAQNLITLIKKEKFFFTSKFQGKSRVKITDEAFRVNRALNGEDTHFEAIDAPNTDLLTELKTLMVELYSYIEEGRNGYQGYKLKEYADTDKVKVKLCRDLVSELEDRYVNAEVTLSDIKYVYNYLNKPMPKKYIKVGKSNKVSKDIFNAISAAIAPKAQQFKDELIEHYANMVHKIDPQQSIANTKEFVKAARMKIADIHVVRICTLYRFDKAVFNKAVDEHYDNQLRLTASRVAEYASTSSENPRVEINHISPSSKGFDVSLLVDGQQISARAISVIGAFVSFHYRYIVHAK